MNFRRFASIGMAISGVIVSVTGIVLLFHTPFKIYMKSVHEYFGYFFIAVMLVHIVYNIKPLKNYIARKKPNFQISREMVSNTVIAVLLAALTLNIAGSKVSGMGDSPYPGVEDLPLNIVLETNGFDYDTALARLASLDYKVPESDAALTLLDLSKAYNMNPKVVYGIMTKIDASRAGANGTD